MLEAEKSACGGGGGARGFNWGRGEIFVQDTYVMIHT